MRPLKPFSASLRRLYAAAAAVSPQTADELISLTRLERYDNSIPFRLKMGLNNYGPAVVPSPSSSTAGKSSLASTDAAAEGKMVFDVKLEKYNASAKIKVIKEVRGFTDLGLKEAKDLVEKVPAIVKKCVTKEEGNAILEKLKQLGAAPPLYWNDTESLDYTKFQKSNDLGLIKPKSFLSIQHGMTSCFEALTMM